MMAAVIRLVKYVFFIVVYIIKKPQVVNNYGLCRQAFDQLKCVFCQGEKIELSRNLLASKGYVDRFSTV